jgi:superfamily II DNA or RNA helicase
MKPKDWQADALNEFIDHKEQCFLLEATPAAGKTIFSGFCARHLLENNVADFVLVIVPSTAIKGDSDAGFLGDWNKLDLQITTVLRDGQGCPTEYSGAVITYQQLPNIVNTVETWASNGKRIFVVADEIHHASENVWGTAIEQVSRCAVKVLAMTGTLFRGDGRAISFVNYDTDGKAIPDFCYRYREAVRDRRCREVSFISDDGLAEFVWEGGVPEQVRLSEAKNERDQSSAARTIFRGDAEWLRRTIERVDACLSEYRTWDPDAAALIVCRPAQDDNDIYAQRYVDQVAEMVRKETGEAPVVVTHDDPNSNALIERFRKSDDRYICAIRKVSEGVDIKRIRVVLIATRITTELLFRQIVGRALRVDDEKHPGDATVYIPKFQHLVEWARTIEEEVKAGLRERDPKPREPFERSEGRGFSALGSEHEEGGGFSTFGDEYSAAEINAAERFKIGDQQLFGVPVTTIAYLRRKLNVESDPTEAPHEPLQIQKKRIRKDLVRLARQLAIRRNPENPDFKAVFKELGRVTGVYTLDELVDNRSIEVMQQALALLSQWLGQSNAAA